MKLGILNACTPQDEEEIQAWEYPNFQRFLTQADPHLTLAEFRITEGDFPASNFECDAYLITGSPKGAYDDEAWIERLSNFIRSGYAEKRKMVGICFGHQVLAQALGGRVEQAETGWDVGLHRMEIVRHQPWMSPWLPRGKFYFCHQDQVTQLPSQAELIAKSELCPISSFVMGKEVLGIQAHPEFTAEVMKKALDWLCTITEFEQRAEVEATASTQGPDNAVMARWIVNFLQ